MRKIAAFAFAVVAALSASAVKVEWYQDVDNVSQTKVVVCYHGEDLRLFIKPRKNGSDHAITGSTAEGWWQTKEMGDAWTRTNAVINTYTELGDTKYRFEITWPKGREGNADEVRFFVKWSNGGEAPGETPNPGVGEISYRINFIIKFLGSPGANPTEVPIPRRVLDFAKTEVRNSPYLTAEDVTQFATWEAIQSWWDEAKADVENVTNMLTEAVAEVAATTTALRVEMKNYVDAEIQTSGLTTPTTVTNIVDAKIAAIPKDGVSTNAVNFIISEAARTNWLCTVATAQQKANAAQNAAIADAAGKYLVKASGISKVELVGDEAYPAIKIGDTAGVYNVKAGLLGMVFNTPVANGTLAWPNKSGTFATTDDIPDAYTKAEANAAYYPKSQGNQLAASVGTIAAHLNAEDARFVSTNYDSVVRTPEAYVEIKINNNWQTIWREMTRWDKFTGAAFDWTNWGGFNTWRTNVNEQMANKADRCWGIYDSETGEYSPDGFTQISSSNILIASGMAYRRAVETKNIWVLQCNGGTATLGGETNGYFRIKDGDGNTQFEIIKGNQRELGCDADSITVSGNQSYTVVGIDYSVVANQHPTLKICGDLSTADWKTEGTQGCIGTVSWSGSSGAYHANVRVYNTHPAAFIKATYLGGSETVINNVAPTKMQYIYIGNQKYAIGYTTINGTGVMTLTPQ